MTNQQTKTHPTTRSYFTRAQAGRAVLIAVAAAAASAGCRSDRVDSFDPRNFDLANQQRDAAQGLAPSAAVALPQKRDETLYNPDATRPELERHFRADPLLGSLSAEPRVVLVDLRTAIQRAVVSNLDVRVAAFQPAIDEARVTEAEGRFDPTVFANLSANRDRSVNFQNSIGGGRSNTWTAVAEVGIRQLLESGGQLQVSTSYSFYDFETQPQFGVGGGPEQRYVSDISVEFSQPLLRDFGNEINNARIVINRNNQQISLLDFRNTLDEQLQRLEQVYWQLVQAQREVDIQQRLLQRTIDTSIILALRGRQDVSRVQLGQASFSIAQRRSQLVQARSNVADLSDRLKRLMNDPTLPIAGPDLLLPSTEPVLEQVIYDPQQVINEAVRYRPEIGQQQLRIDSALVALSVAKNNKAPRFDIVVRGSLQSVDEDNAGSAVANQFNLENNWQGAGSLQLQFEYPLSNSAALSIEKRARLQYQQAVMQYQANINQVMEDTKLALRQVQTAYVTIATSRQARLDAEEALRALQVREDQGEALTPQFVDQKLRQQEQLAQAERDEVAAISTYNIALATLERAKGTLLRYNNVVLQEDSLPSR